MNVGDVVLLGKRRAKVARIADVPAPSGARVAMAEIEFPRGGRQWCFRADLVPFEEGPRPKVDEPSEAFA